MSHNILEAHGGYAGWYKIEAMRLDADGLEIPGSRRVAADWFPNLITNAGLDFLGTAGDTLVFGFVRVGSGNTAPAFTDTALVSQVAVSSTQQGTVTSGVNRTGTFYAWKRRTVRFVAGSMGGSSVNLAEVGVSPAGTGALFSRALILDGGGSPTSITVLPDEVLDVTYELRLYPTTTDATGTVNIEGVVYNWTARALLNTYYDACWVELGPAVGPKLNPAGFALRGPGAAADLPPQNVEVVAPVTAGLITAIAYTGGTYQRSFRFDLDLNDGNVAGGIGCLFAASDGTGAGRTFGAWGWGLSPKLPKTAAYKASFTFRMSWGRYTP